MCDEEQVRGIFLTDNNLSGSLPMEIAFLADSLINIDLNTNSIYMEEYMFEVFAHLSNLESLIFDDNLLTTTFGCWIAKSVQSTREFAETHIEL